MSIGSRNRFAISSAAEGVFATPINISASSVGERIVFSDGALAAGGLPAIAYPVISGGVIQSPIYIVYGGSYATLPTIVVQPAGGSGATFSVSGSGGAVTSITVGGSGGTGYSVASTGTAKSFPVRMDRPVVNIETATDEDTLTGVLEAGLNSIVTKQTVTASTELDARLDAIGVFGRYALGNVSRVYLTLLTLTGGTGQVTAAEVYAVIRDGVAVDYVIANPGSYTTIPTAVTNITGSTAASFTLSGSTSVTGVTITAAGANLNATAAAARLLQFSGGGGSGAVAITKAPTAASLPAPRAYIVNGGSGYTSAPTVTIPGGGSGISYTATVSNGVVTALTAAGTSSATLYTNATGLYAHTMTVGTGDSPSATLYFQDPFSGFASTTAHQYAGANVQRMTIRSEAGGKITTSVEFLASGVHTLSQTITGMPSISTEGILGASRISQFLIDGTDLKAYLKSFEITFENTFDDAAEMASGSKTLPALERTGTMVSGSFTLKSDASVAGTTASILTEILGTAFDQSGAVDFDLRIEGVVSGHICQISLPNAILDNTAITGQRGKLEKPVGFKGFYDTVSARASQVVVANTTRTYLS